MTAPFFFATPPRVWQLALAPFSLSLPFFFFFVPWHYAVFKFGGLGFSPRPSCPFLPDLVPLHPFTSHRLGLSSYFPLFSLPSAHVVPFFIPRLPPNNRTPLRFFTSRTPSSFTHSELKPKRRVPIHVLNPLGLLFPLRFIKLFPPRTSLYQKELPFPSRLPFQYGPLPRRATFFLGVLPGLPSPLDCPCPSDFPFLDDFFFFLFTTFFPPFALPDSVSSVILWVRFSKLGVHFCLTPVPCVHDACAADPFCGTRFTEVPWCSLPFSLHLFFFFSRVPMDLKRALRFYPDLPLPYTSQFPSVT